MRKIAIIEQIHEDGLSLLENNSEYKSPYKLWDNSLQKNLQSVEIDHDEIINSDQGPDLN